MRYARVALSIAHISVIHGLTYSRAHTLSRRKQLKSQVEVDLPSDVVPTGQEFERQLEAVTLDHNCMDEDMRDALQLLDEEGAQREVLFGDGDEFDFEEIDDDFVATAMTEPETQDFDYDKHIGE